MRTCHPTELCMSLIKIQMSVWQKSSWGQAAPFAHIRTLPSTWQLLFETPAVRAHPTPALARFYCSPHQCIKRAASFHVWDKTRPNLSLRLTSEGVLCFLLFHLIPPLPSSTIHLKAPSFENQRGNNYTMKKKKPPSTFSCNILFILYFHGGWCWVISAEYAPVRKYLNVNYL